MAAANEKTTMAGGVTGSPKPSTGKSPNVNAAGDSDSTHTEIPQGIADDEYPHGLKLILLTGASIVAVFLIALDQVSTLPTHAVTVKNLNTSDTKGI
jgi:hypothetical protein